MSRIPRTFLAQDPSACRPDQASVVLVPVPYDATTSSQPGARGGPEAILNASLQLEEYDMELEALPLDVGIHVDQAVEPDLSAPGATVDQVRRVCDEWLARGKFVIVLGGEHSVAVGAGWAAADHFGEVSFLQIDAHMDLRDSYQGSPFSHACTARRLWERGRVVAVGIRNASAEEASWARRQGATIVTAQRIAQSPDDSWMDEVMASLSDRVYVTFDIDGLDSSLAPATGTPEPGGLGYWQTLRLLRRLAREKTVVGADLCELAPMPGQYASSYLAASIVYKMVGYFVAER